MVLAKRLFFKHDDRSGKSLVVNSVSGAFDLMPLSLGRKLEACRGREIPGQVLTALEGQLETLRARGYLFDDPQQEVSRLRELRQRIDRAYPKLTKFVICPTYSCNLACTYCYEGDLTQRVGVMSSEQLRMAMEAIDKLKQRPDVMRYLYELFGGEPLLPISRNIIAEFLDMLEKRAGTAAIVTNGTNVEGFLPLLKQHRATIESLQITIDGPRVIHDRRRRYRGGEGSFDEIVRAVDQLLAEGFFVRLRINVDRQNLEYVPALLLFMERRDWTLYRNFTCDVAPVTYHTQFVRNKEVMQEDELVTTIMNQFPELLRPQSQCNLAMFRVLNHVISVLEPQRTGIRILPTFTYCEATEGSVYVFGVDGAIYACPDAIIDRKWAIGQYWPTFSLDEERANTWHRDIFSIPECSECEIATLCGGGCALVPLDNGSHHPFCNGAHETLDAYLSAWFERHFRGPQPMQHSPTAGK